MLQSVPAAISGPYVRLLNAEVEGKFYLRKDVRKAVGEACGWREELTGAEFRAKLETKLEDMKWRHAEALAYMHWGEDFRRREIERRCEQKNIAHQKRVKFIIEYCKVLP